MSVRDRDRDRDRDPEQYLSVPCMTFVLWLESIGGSRWVRPMGFLGV